MSNMIELTFQQFQIMFGTQKQRISQGSQGITYTSQNKQNQKFIIKEYSKIMISLKNRIKKEISILEKVKHLRNVPLIEFYKIGNKIYQVSKFIQNGPLLTFNLTNLSQSQKWGTSYGIAEGIFEIQKNKILHRDINPYNIYMDDKLTPLIGNFGNATWNNQKLQKIGNNLYRHPSVLNGLYTHKCDLYSLGLVIYFIFTGKNLFESQNRDDLNKERRSFLSNVSHSIDKLQLDISVKNIMRLIVCQDQKECMDTDKLIPKIKDIFQQKKASLLMTTSQSHLHSKSSNFPIQILSEHSLFPEKLIDFKAELNLMQKLDSAKKKINKIKILENYSFSTVHANQFICFFAIYLYHIWLQKVQQWLGGKLYDFQNMSIDKISSKVIKEVKQYLIQQKKRTGHMMRKCQKSLYNKKQLLKNHITSELMVIVESYGNNNKKMNLDQKTLIYEADHFYSNNCMISHNSEKNQKRSQQYNKLYQLISQPFSNECF